MRLHVVTVNQTSLRGLGVRVAIGVPCRPSEVGGVCTVRQQAALHLHLLLELLHVFEFLIRVLDSVLSCHQALSRLRLLGFLRCLLLNFFGDRGRPTCCLGARNFSLRLLLTGWLDAILRSKFGVAEVAFASAVFPCSWLLHEVAALNVGPLIGVVEDLGQLLDLRLLEVKFGEQILEVLRGHLEQPVLFRRILLFKLLVDTLASPDGGRLDFRHKNFLGKLLVEWEVSGNLHGAVLDPLHGLILRFPSASAPRDFTDIV